MVLTVNRAMIAFGIVMASQLLNPLLSDSYAIRKERINIAVDACLVDYQQYQQGSKEHLGGCNKCFGLGMSMLHAHGGIIDPIDYHMTIAAKACRGYKKLKPVMVDLPANPLRKLSKIMAISALLVFFIPAIPVQKISHKLGLSALTKRYKTKPITNIKRH